MLLAIDVSWNMDTRNVSNMLPLRDEDGEEATETAWSGTVIRAWGAGGEAGKVGGLGSKWISLAWGAVALRGMVK